MPPELGARDPASGPLPFSSWHLAQRLCVTQAKQEPLEMPSPDLYLQVILCVRTVLLACQLHCKNLELINSTFRSWQLFPGRSFVALATLAPVPPASMAADACHIGKTL